MNKSEIPKVVLVNDTSLFSTHFGCQLVGQVFREQFKRIGVDLVLSIPKNFDERRYAEQLAAADLVVVNGEGSIHHGRNTHLLDLATRYRAVLVNCTYESNSENEALHRFLYIATRESRSAGEVMDHGVSCRVVPDVIFNSSFVKAYPRPEISRELGVTDNVVKEYVGRRPFRRKFCGDFPAHKRTPAQYLHELGISRRMCVGRFHAAVVCSIMNIPFSSWDSNTWKMEGLMEDMGIGYLHFSSRVDAMAHVPDQLPPSVGAFVPRARLDIENMFDHLRELAYGRDTQR